MDPSELRLVRPANGESSGLKRLSGSAFATASADQDGKRDRDRRAGSTLLSNVPRMLATSRHLGKITSTDRAEVSFCHIRLALSYPCLPLVVGLVEVTPAPRAASPFCNVLR
jgi:hypothetical protein